MILSTSSYQDIFSAMADEEAKIRFFLLKEEARAARLFRQRLPFTGGPQLHHALYTVPSSRNTYLVWVFAGAAVEVARRAWSKGAALLVTESSGTRVVYQKKSLKDSCQDGAVSECLQMFTSHFFGRYRERTQGNKDASPDELIAGYLARNGAYLVGINLERMNFAHGNYKDGMAFQVREGVSMGTFIECGLPDGRRFSVIRHNTFLSWPMLGENQNRNTLSTSRIAGILTNSLTQQNPAIAL